MARGISENDVWTASDALLLEGARPTIERVRQKIGRGSPNTVSPYLDTWFKNLGGRIADPGGFAAPPSPPDPVLQAARHFWEVASAATRLDFDARLSAGLAAAVAIVEAEKDRAATAEAAALEATGMAARLSVELSARNELLEQEKLSAARAAAHLVDAQRQIDDLTQRLSSAQTQLVDGLEASRQEVAAALERYSGAMRRALLDIDAERILRAKAEKRVEALDRRLESTAVASTAAVAEARSLQMRSAQDAVTAKAELTRLTRELAAALAGVDDANKEGERLIQLLVTEQRAAEHARGEASVARAFLAQFGKKTERFTPRKRPAKSAV